MIAILGRDGLASVKDAWVEKTSKRQAARGREKDRTDTPERKGNLMPRTKVLVS